MNYKGEGFMEIEKNFGEDNSLCIKPVGRIDIMSAEDFSKEVLSSINNIEALTLDFSEVIYVSSAGLRAILEIAKNIEINNGNLQIVNVPRNILDIFRMTGFDKILNIG